MNIHAYPSDITSCPNSIFLPVSRNTSCPEARQFEQGTSRFLFHLSSTDANDALLIRPLYLHIFSRALTSFSALPPPFLPPSLSPSFPLPLSFSRLLPLLILRSSPPTCQITCGLSFAVRSSNHNSLTRD